MKISNPVILLVLCTGLTISTACGQKKWDNGGGDSLWTTAANWNPDGVPTLADTVIFDNTFVSGSFAVYDTSNTVQTVHSCQIGYTGNTNTIMLVVGGATANVLTLSGGGSSALNITDGGVLKNTSRNGTRSIKMTAASDVFRMSGTARYVHATTTSGSSIPELTSGTTSANYSFSSSSVFENRSGSSASFDSIPVYGTYEYNVSATKSAGTSLTITGDLLVDRGTLGVGSSSTNRFAIDGNVFIDSGAAFRGNSGSGKSSITVAGNVSGRGTLQGSSSGTGTTNITVGGSITSTISFGSGITTVVFSGGANSVSFNPANSTTPTVKNIIIASGKTVTYDPAKGVNLSIASGNTLTVNGTLNLGTHAVSGTGNITLTGTLGIGDAAGLNGNVTISGTRTFDEAAFVYNGNLPQVTGTSLPTAVRCLTIENDSNLTLSRNTKISDTLSLIRGKIILCANNLIIASSGTIDGASPSGYVMADSIGFLTRDSVASSGVVFPVGTATSYTPVIISNTGTTDSFSVNVHKTFTHSPNTSACVNLQWTIKESTAGGSNAALTFQWNENDEVSSTFKRSKPIYIGQWTGTQWVQTPAILAGSNPYTATAGGFSGFSDFGVGNDGALPIELVSFSGTVVDSSIVRLDWTTLSETNCLGFYVERRLQNEPSSTEVSDLIHGAGTSVEQHNYSWIDTTVSTGTYFYRLRQFDLDSDISYSKEIVIAVGTTSVKHGVVPKSFSLMQNYPNPFNPITEIRYQMPEARWVTLKVYDMLGREVATLVNEVKQPGEYSVTWDASSGGLPSGVTSKGRYASGVYFYRLTSGSNVSVQRMALIK